MQSCFIPSSLYVEVPQTVPTGYVITKGTSPIISSSTHTLNSLNLYWLLFCKSPLFFTISSSLGFFFSVQVADCDTKSMHFTLDDPSFTIKKSGEIQASSPVSVAKGGRTFSVLAQDNSGPGSEMEVHLFHSTILEREVRLYMIVCFGSKCVFFFFKCPVCMSQHTGQGFLKRSKRRWSPPPFNILENDQGPFPRNIEKVILNLENVGCLSIAAYVRCAQRDFGVFMTHCDTNQQIIFTFLVLYLPFVF